jgi:Tfp pilus assembly protein FimV
MKNPFKSKVPEAKVPRAAEEIKKQYYTLLAQAGEFQYQIEVYTNTLKGLNSQLQALNMEMHERQELDKAVQAEIQAKAVKDAAEKATKSASEKAG